MPSPETVLPTKKSNRPPEKIESSAGHTFPSPTQYADGNQRHEDVPAHWSYVLEIVALIVVELEREALTKDAELATDPCGNVAMSETATTKPSRLHNIWRREPSNLYP